VPIEHPDCHSSLFYQAATWDCKKHWHARASCWLQRRTKRKLFVATQRDIQGFKNPSCLLEAFNFTGFLASVVLVYYRSWAAIILE
jgi:hypothetical protein